MSLHIHILAYNNLAHHLQLLGESGAADYAQTGLTLARENGSLYLLPYLLSTLGEIALAQDDLESAERYFTEGLSLAKQFSASERIAGLTANLGLVAVCRGQTSLAIEHFSTALAQADTVGASYLAAQTRLWLAPLLPPAEARTCLVEVRRIAERSSYRRLLDEVTRLEAQIP